MTHGPLDAQPTEGRDIVTEIYGDGAVAGRLLAIEIVLAELLRDSPRRADILSELAASTRGLWRELAEAGKEGGARYHYTAQTHSGAQMVLSRLQQTAGS
jgi:hypothetical protein